MKIKIIKNSNLYIFVSNLSQWNGLTCVPKRKKQWLAETGGKFSQKEKEYIKKFTKIMRESKENLEPIFLFENKNLKKKLMPQIGEKETLKIIKIIKYFEKNRFNKIWAKELKKLKKYSHTIKESATKLEEVIKSVAKLCGDKDINTFKNTPVYLLINSKEENIRAWNWGDQITVECSGTNERELGKTIIEVLSHEFFHLFLKKNKKLNYNLKKISFNTKNKLFKEWGKNIIVEEALVSSFTPEGYLSEKNSGRNIRKIAKNKIRKAKNDLEKLRYYCALNLYDISKNYVENEKKVDNQYLKALRKVLVNFEKSK